MSFFKDKVESVGGLQVGASGNNEEDFVPAIKLNATANTAAADVVTITNAAFGQASTLTIPDPGGASAKFVLDTGTNAAGVFTDLSYGAAPLHMVDPGSCTIVAAAGTTNVSNVTVQLKDGAGNNISRSIPFKVYASSAADGLTLASAASTGFAVSSGGLKLPNENSSITQGISCVSSATGGCVLTLTDTGKQTSYLVLMTANGAKISAQLSAGSYG